MVLDGQGGPSGRKLSSAVYIEFDDQEGVLQGKFLEFCSSHDIEYSPQTIGGNVFYYGGHGGVEVTFGEASYEELPALPNGCLDFSAATPPEYAERVRFSTFHMGREIPCMAELARAFWIEFGGAVSCDPELRALFVSTLEKIDG